VSSAGPPDTIAAARAALGAGTTTARALVEASLDAIDAGNARVNAFITVDAAGARAAADAVDAERARGLDRGPLHGIPYSLKDLVDVAGVVTTAGSRVLEDRVPAADAAIVTRLGAAGAICIGRTNLHEFAMGTTSEDSAFGPVRHPLDPSRSPGGSSGGSAAAVASGMGLASIGTDTGGSVRIPAAVCGIVGLKPTYGEVPAEGVVPLSASLDHVGPLARTVQDCAWMFAVLAGLAPRVVEPRDPRGLTLVRPGGYFDALVETPVRTAVDRAIARLVAAGVAVTPGTIAGTGAIPAAYLPLVVAEAADWHAPYLDARADRYTPPVLDRIRLGRTTLATDYLAARRMQGVLAGHVDAALAGADALVLPCVPLVAPPVGATDVRLDPSSGATLPIRSAMLRLTQLFNLTGHPAISIPVPVDGLPVGLQIVGKWHADATVLRAAACFEAAQPWAQVRPPLD
jgi:aspartyl-tRNA(Asn)/glutamyl-tRNA(Gln) amidotransferase subunit A